jgi:hypothetical protein
MYINNIIEEMKLFNNTLYESHEIYFGMVFLFGHIYVEYFSENIVFETK